MIITRELVDATEYRCDGNFWCVDFCMRCESLFYTHAMQNTGMVPAYRLCPWCRGECSAAEQDHRNAAIEVQI